MKLGRIQTEILEIMYREGSKLDFKPVKIIEKATGLKYPKHANSDKKKIQAAIRNDKKFWKSIKPKLEKWHKLSSSYNRSFKLLEKKGLLRKTIGAKYRLTETGRRVISHRI